MSAWHCEDCGREVIGKIRRGRCQPCYRKHLSQVRESGSDNSAPARKYRPRRSPRNPIPAAERVFRRTVPGWGGCVLYAGAINVDGYGLASRNGRLMGAHRLVYLDLVGEIPQGHMLDHICHSSDASCPGGSTCLHRRCVNPNHLEPVTPAENTMRGRSRSAENFLKTECMHGHPFTPENTQLLKRLRHDGRPQRRCRECRRIANRKWANGTRKLRRRQSKTAQ